MKNTKQAFTLLEILLVVAAIAILAGIVIMAINPNKQLGDARNAQRRVDVNTILNATYQYIIDNNGTVPTQILSGTACGVATQEICRTSGTCTSLTDLSILTTDGEYLVSMPIDPNEGATQGTGYEIYKNATSGRITVCATSPENSATISVTR